MGLKWTITTALALSMWMGEGVRAQSFFASEAYRFLLKLPSGWAAQLSEDPAAPSLYAVTADDAAVVYFDILLDSFAGLEELIEKMENDMDLAWDDELSRQMRNGMEVLWGTGAGVVNDTNAAVVVFAARNGRFTYVGYGACPLNQSSKYFSDLKSIVASLAPLP